MIHQDLKKIIWPSSGWREPGLVLQSRLPGKLRSSWACRAGEVQSGVLNAATNGSALNRHQVLEVGIQCRAKQL